MQGTMPIDQILRLPSIDSDGIWDQSDDLDTWTVENAIKSKDIDDDYHEAIMDSMAENGINLVPIHIGKAIDVISGYTLFRSMPPGLDSETQLMLGNGHHRVAIALELGLKDLLYSTDRDETGWGDEDMFLVTKSNGQTESAIFTEG